MGTILVMENDPVFGAVLEDRLHVAGHEVELLRDRESALPSAAESPKDLLVLEIAQPGNRGLEVVAALRQRAETRTLPILVLSESVESADRVAALRAGADDYLTKPCDLEELMLRAERLLGARAAPRPVLQGDLASHPLWELVQFLQHAGQSGSLALRGPSGSGRFRIAGGKIVSAHWEELPPREALLAIFGMKQGTFRFVAEDGGADFRGEPLPAHDVLMEAAWLEDELEKRRDRLPVSGAPLSVTGETVPDGGDFDSLPIAEILAAVGDGTGVRLFDLMKKLPSAPQKIRLAVAWLVEQNVLGLPVDAAQVYPTTSEITSAELVDLAVTELLASARAVGFGTSALPFLILVDPVNRSSLVDMLETVPGFRRNEGLQGLRENVGANRSGSVSFPVDLGKLVLHVKALDPAVRDEIASTVTVSAGVLLWLGGAAEPELAKEVIERLEASRGAARGVVVATRTEVLELARRWIEGKSHWRASSHAPQSLLGVFRLLQPGWQG